MQRRLADRMAALEADWRSREAAQAAEAAAAASKLLSLEAKARQVSPFLPCCGCTAHSLSVEG